MELQKLERHIQEAINDLHKLIPELSEASENYELLSNMTKSILAIEASKHEGAESTRERLGRASDEFVAHIKGLAVAKGKLTELIAKKAVLDKKFEASRTLISLEKGKMNLT